MCVVLMCLIQGPPGVCSTNVCVIVLSCVRIIHLHADYLLCGCTVCINAALRNVLFYKAVRGTEHYNVTILL